MRDVLRATVLVMVTTVVCAAGSQTVSPLDLQNRAGLHKPQDTAPPEQIVIPRPADECRPRKSLLAGARHESRLVDTGELHRRKIELYAGARISDSLPDADGARRGAVAQTTAASPRTERGAAAGIVFWFSVAACVLLGLWLTARVLLNLRKHQARSSR